MNPSPLRAPLRSTLALALACVALQAQTTTRLSVDSGGIEGNGQTSESSISADGRWVAFVSGASNLVAGDTNGVDDVFVRDLLLGTIVRASVGVGGVQAPTGGFNGTISGDGRFVAFWSASTNLVPGDANTSIDVFVRDLQLATTVRASVGPGGVEGNADSLGPSISANGRYVLFFSFATNLVAGDTNGKADTFVRDLQTGTTARASTSNFNVQGNNDSYSGGISADGRWVAFESYASNLVVADSNSVADVFVKDMQTGLCNRSSVDDNGAEGNSGSTSTSVSDDGKYATFMSNATNLVPGDTNASSDVFLRDRVTFTTTRVSVDSLGNQSNGNSSQPRISGGSRFVTYWSLASNLVPVDLNGKIDVFLRDTLFGKTTLVSLATGGGQGNGDSLLPSITADGRKIAFGSNATNLVAGDTNAVYDVFLRDRGASSSFTPFCYGDGSGAPCPCGNSGAVGKGCENSAATGGAQLVASGTPSLAADTLVLTSSGGLPTSFGIVLQGNASIPQVGFGDGLRCAGGTLSRMYTKAAVGGVITAPQGGDPTISARSAALGDPIPSGGTRFYQVYYRDPDTSFCPTPTGNTFNVSGAVAVAWGV